MSFSWVGANQLDLSSTDAGKGSALVAGVIRVVNAADYATPELALAATSAGDTLYFPEGTHALAAQLHVSHALTIVFSDGAELIPSVGYTDNQAIYITASDVRIINPRIDGTNLPRLGAAYDGSQTPKGVGIYGKGTVGSEIERLEVVGGHIRDCPMLSIMFDGVASYRVSGVRTTNGGAAHAAEDTPPGDLYFVRSPRGIVDFNAVTTPGMKGIAFATGSDDCLVQGNTVSGGVVTGFAGVFGSNVAGWKCIGNTVRDMFGVKYDGGATHSSGYVITGNTVYNAKNSGIMVQGGGMGAVSGNTVIGYAADGAAPGIYLFGDPSDVSGLGPLVVSENVVVHTGTATSGMEGITVYSDSNYGPVQDVHLLNNVVKAAYTGFYCRIGTGATFTRLRIAGNIVEDAVYNGISVFGQGHSIHDNTILNPGNVGVFVAGLSGATATDDISIARNKITGSTSYPIYIYNTVVATALEIVNNRLSSTALGIVVYEADIASMDISGNDVRGTTLSASISLSAHATTAHIVRVVGNRLAKTISWNVASGGTFSGFCGPNIYGVAMTTAPLGVVCVDYGTGVPTITRPYGSIYHRTDLVAGGPNLYVRQRDAGDSADEWVGH